MLVTLHPETKGTISPKRQINILLSSIKNFKDIFLFLPIQTKIEDINL